MLTLRLRKGKIKSLFCIMAVSQWIIMICLAYYYNDGIKVILIIQYRMQCIIKTVIMSIVILSNDNVQNTNVLDWLNHDIVCNDHAGQLWALKLV